MTTLAHRASGSHELDLELLRAVFDSAAAAAERAGGAAEAIEAALDVLHEELGHAGVAAFVLEHGRLWSVGVRGYAMIPDGLPLDEGVIGRAVRACEVQHVPDVTGDPDFVGVSERVVSELAIPLVGSTGVVGAINVETAARLPVGSAEAASSLAQALTRPIDELRAARTVDVSTLARLFVYMSSLRDPRAIAEVAVRSLGRVLPLESSRLLLLDDEERLVELSEWSASGLARDTLPVPALELLRRRVETSAVFALFDASATEVPELKGLRVRSVVLIRLRANGAELGLLAGASRFPREFDRVQGELAALLAAHTAASLDAAIALERERRSAHTDALTGLLNRRGIEDGLEGVLGGAQVERRPLSLVVLDLDDFKEVNDRAGHEVGDALLREVGLALARVSPEGAVTGRIGGDEFVVGLPGLDTEAALEVTQQLRGDLSERLDEAGFPLRLSAGISTYPYDGEGTTQLLRSADQALYRAKARGKNCAIGFREIVGGASAADVPLARPEPTRSADVTGLAEVTEAVDAIWSEGSPEAVLDRLTRAISFLVGATATAVSKIEGDRLVDVTHHALRDVEIGTSDTYLIADYPITREVLETGRARSISFLDEDLDAAEAFVLRQLQMNAAMLLPLRLHGRTWGLVEIYDMRMRRFTADDEAVGGFLVTEAGRRIEALRREDGRRVLRSPRLRR